MWKTVNEPLTSTGMEFTNLRVSTMVITAHWGSPIQLASVFESLKNYILPLWYPAEGVLKIEYGNRVLGWSYKDVFTNRKISDKTFFNQSTIVVRRKVEDEKENHWKEVNIKLFANGGIQMTGVTSEAFARSALDWLYELIQTFPESPFTQPVHIHRFSVQLINTDYSINRFINQDALHKLLINEYNLFSMLEKTIYQGVNTKYFYNSTNKQSGICSCEKICKGQGMGDGEGQCKRITMSIFRTGKVIITGARQMKQIETAYEFLNEIFQKHQGTVYVPVM
jgi:TATA-box binding protein (TBP) (component of TFIID and TFIIIB)